MNETYWMKECFRLAKKGVGRTGTNPLVGALIVKDGKILSRGYHEKYGGAHGEAIAISNAKEDLQGATLFVTLEPCCHVGKTPPCTDKIINAGIGEVVISVLDPDPRVSGKGIKILQNHGIKVKTGILEKEGNVFYQDYFMTKKRHRPKVILKVGMSLDGKTATKTGESKWITNEKSRQDGHKWRGKVDGIVVGMGTILKDDPLLTNRSGWGKDPTPIILDSHLSISPFAKVFQGPTPPMIFTNEKDETKVNTLEEKGAKVVQVSKNQYGLDLQEVLHHLYDLGFASILIEGGGKVHGSFVDQTLVDEVCFYIAPILIGGKEAKSSIEGYGINGLKEALSLENLKVCHLDEDIKITGRVKCLQD